MRCVFFAVLSHKLNVIFHISTCSIWEYSNPTDTSAENVTLCGSFTELAELNYLCICTLYYFAQYFPDEIMLFCSGLIVERCVSVFMDYDNVSHRRGAWNFQNTLPPSTSPMSSAKWRKYLWECTLERFLHRKIFSNTVSILLFLMFEKCRFCENYPRVEGGGTLTSTFRNIVLLTHFLR